MCSNAVGEGAADRPKLTLGVPPKYGSNDPIICHSAKTRDGGDWHLPSYGVALAAHVALRIVN